MENKMNKPVDVICYGVREHFDTRQQAINKYAKGINASEGSEQARYVQIHYALVHGSADIVTDGSSERVESEPLVKFTVQDKDEIIKLINAEVLYINSPEIYDGEKCKLVVEDRDIIKALLKKDGWYAAQFLRGYIENDKALLLDAARGGTGERGALAYASEQLQNDKDFVFEMLKIDASDVRNVSDRLSNDIEVIQFALKHAETDYDIDCIKEVLGKDLLLQMVESLGDRYTIAKAVEMEDFKNTLGYIDCDFAGLSDAEIESMYDDFNEKLANDDTYSSIYGETAFQAFKEFMENKAKAETLEGPKNSLAEKIAAAESVKASEHNASSKRFDVTITETLKMTVQVEAESLLEAEQMVSDRWDNSDYILDADHFTGVEFEAKAVKEKIKNFDSRDER